MTAIEASRLSKIAHIEMRPVEVTRQPFRAATFGPGWCAGKRKQAAAGASIQRVRGRAVTRAAVNPRSNDVA